VSWRESTCPRRPARCGSTACRPSPTARTAPCSSSGGRRSTARRSSTRDARPPWRGIAHVRETKALGAELSGSHRCAALRVRSRYGPRRGLGLVVGRLGDRSRCRRSDSDWLAQARAWNAALFALGTPSTPSAPLVRSTATTSSWCRRSTSRMPRRPPRSPRSSHVAATRGRPVLGRRRRHREGARRRRAGPLRELLGVEVDEQWPIPDGRTERVELAASSSAIPSERVARTARRHRGARTSPLGRARRAGSRDRRAHADGGGGRTGTSVRCSSPTG
jgi:hypothetical protein